MGMGMATNSGLFKSQPQPDTDTTAAVIMRIQVRELLRIRISNCQKVVFSRHTQTHVRPMTLTGYHLYIPREQYTHYYILVWLDTGRVCLYRSEFALLQRWRRNIEEGGLNNNMNLWSTNERITKIMRKAWPTKQLKYINQSRRPHTSLYFVMLRIVNNKPAVLNVDNILHHST